jgi:undecaprenyl-diphosphatase
MKNKLRKKLCICACALAAFALWTAAVCLIDVQPIGPQESAVGFAVLNRSFHNLTGVHMTLYTVTDWLGLVPVAFGLGFALLGLQQWIRRRSLRKVEPSILVLGGFYIVVAAAYVLFEAFVINYRPVLINGILEASYPSSTTLLVLCVMPTAAMQMNARISNRALRRGITAAIVIFIAFMIVGRLISGVHWLTDIIGGILLSAGLVALYDFLIHFASEK